MKIHLLVLFSVIMGLFSVFSPYIGASLCEYDDVDVYNLHVSGNQITSYIKNNKDSSQTFVYVIYVNGEVIVEETLSIEEGETKHVSYSYAFEPGRYEIAVETEISCGYIDRDELVYNRFEDNSCDDCDYCTEGSLRCDCEHKKVYQCLDDDWVLLAEGNNEYCEICGDEECCGDLEPCWDCELCGCEDCSCYHDHSCDCDYTCDYDHYDCYCDCHKCEYPEKKDCGIYIEEFNYIDMIEEGKKAVVEVRVSNTGRYREVITVRLFVDGIMKDSNSVSVAKHRDFTRKFTFYPTIGTHEVKVSAKANCGSSDWVSRIVKVVELGEHVEPPEFPGPEPIPTSIEISPINIDIPRYDAKTVVINIHSEVPQYFRIDVRDHNFERNWIEYEREFWVEEDRSAYVYISPDEYGEYGMDIFVTARTEWKIVREHVKFFVAEPGPKAQKEYDWFAGLVNFFTHPATVIVAIIISLGIVLYTGTKILIPEPEAWEA